MTSYYAQITDLGIHMPSFIKTAVISAMLVTSATSWAESNQSSQVHISGDNQSLRINIVESNGKSLDIELDIDESTSGKVTKEVMATLREKGVIIASEDNQHFSIHLEDGESLGELEGLNVLHSLKLLKALEILQDLEGLEHLDGNTNISIEIESHSAE